MADDLRSTSDSAEELRNRVTQDLTGRLFARGIEVHSDDTGEQVSDMEEAVLRFESRVIARGGDLMVDEPPRGEEGQPDKPGFQLPLRRADESAEAFIERLARATDDLRADGR